MKFYECLISIICQTLVATGDEMFTDAYPMVMEESDQIYKVTAKVSTFNDVLS